MYVCSTLLVCNKDRDKYEVVEIDLKNGIQKFMLVVGFTYKMHWYNYNNMLPLLNVEYVFTQT